MAFTIERTARSPLLHIRDFSTGLLDADHRMLCQHEGIPLLAYSYPLMLDHLVEVLGDDIYPGDLFIHNDPYFGNNQAQDTAFFKPVFVDGRLRFWAASKGHLADWGGTRAGGYNPAATDLWQETIRLPPLKVWERGELRRDVWTMLLANTRLPQLVGGDMQALAGACHRGELRLLELARSFGEGFLLRHVDAVLDTTHEHARREIAAWPPGAYSAEASWKSLPPGLEASELVCRLKVTIGDGTIHFDFTGSDPQTSRYFNGAYATTYAALIATLLVILDPSIQHNEGLERCLEVTLPRGSFLNAAEPAPTVLGNFVMNDVVGEAVMKALAQAVPERVTAGWHRGLNLIFDGVDPRNGRFFSALPLMSNKGGGGGTMGVDGWSSIGILTAPGNNQFDDYEEFEHSFPVTLLEHELWEGSFGRGRWRGGLGVHLALRVHTDVLLTTFGDGVDRPFGLFGGEPGGRSDILVTPPGSTPVTVLPNSTSPVESGSTIEAHNSGGGGFGPPGERDPVVAGRDIRDGLLGPRI